MINFCAVRLRGARKFYSLAISYTILCNQPGALIGSGGDCLFTRTHELAELSLQACLKTHSYHSAPQFIRQQTTAKEFNCTITWKNWCNHFQKILNIWGTFRQVLKIYICVQPISKCKNVSNVAFGMSFSQGSIK